MKVFLIDFLVLIDLNCSGELILKSAVELREFVDGDEIVDDWLGKQIEVDDDDQLVVSWNYRVMW